MAAENKLKLPVLHSRNRSWRLWRLWTRNPWSPLNPRG